MAKSFVAILTLLLTLAASRPSWAQDDLNFFKQYLVTGDYVVGGVGLRGKGVNGVANGSIAISGVPESADVLAAFLYWQSSTTTGPRAGLKGARFAGHDVSKLAKVLEPEGAGACPVDGSNLGVPQTGLRAYSYRVDVKRFFTVNEATRKLDINRSHQVTLPDNGNGISPGTAGASLVVIYRDPTKPLRAMLLYDGVHTMDAAAGAMSQTFPFFQASNLSPKGRTTHLLSNGQPNLSERVFLDGNPIATNLFVGGTGSSWDNPSLTANPRPGAADATVSVRPVTSQFDCLIWTAAVYATTVQDTDLDGLIDVWESSDIPLHDPSGAVLPNLKAMGARPGVQDVFIEIGYMSTTGYTNPVQGAVPAHSHLPVKQALEDVATALHKAAPRKSITGPIQVHFDIGHHYQPPEVDPKTGQPYSALPSLASCQAPATWVPRCAIIPADLARGGEEIEEEACDPKDPDFPDRTCRFPDYPGTVGWKSGFNSYRDQPLNYPDEPQCLAAGSLCERRFDRNRLNIFRYALFAHGLGLRRDTDPFDCGLPGKVGCTPRNVSGIGDGGAGGGDFMVTLGFWDEVVGTTFVQASTILHEFGHTVGLRHGGAPFQPNCKPNYQSVMNYLFQIRGLINKDGKPVIDYSKQVLPALDELILTESAGLGTRPYQARWWAPLTTSIVDQELDTTPATAQCDGSPLEPGDPDMVRVEGDRLNGAIDWTADGDKTDAGFAQDLSFANGITALDRGFNDFQALDLRQVGGRRNAGSQRLGGGLSLQVGFGDLGFGDLGFGDLGFGDLGFGDLGFGDLGFGDLGFGDLGFGDLGVGDRGFGDLGASPEGAPVGDLDFETVLAIAQAPDTLSAALTSGGVALTWTEIHAGELLFYEVYRVPGIGLTPANVGARTFVGRVIPPGTSLVDTAVLTPGAYSYFVVAVLGTDPNLPIKRSGPSNVVTVTIP